MWIRTDGGIVGGGGVQVLCLDIHVYTTTFGI
jgi:hypothetical protein